MEYSWLSERDETMREWIGKHNEARIEADCNLTISNLLIRTSEK